MSGSQGIPTVYTRDAGGVLRATWGTLEVLSGYSRGYFTCTRLSTRRSFLYSSDELRGTQRVLGRARAVLTRCKRGAGAVPTRCRRGADAVATRYRCGLNAVPTWCRRGTNAVPTRYRCGVPAGVPRGYRAVLGPRRGSWG
jgi:hypothetical protein